MRAYCWQNGVIQFGNHVPEGALWIDNGPEEKLLAAIKATARLAHCNKSLLVPGIPEAKNSKERLDALFAYMARVRKILTEAA
jgi:hypothetical protein